MKNAFYLISGAFLLVVMYSCSGNNQNNHNMSTDRNIIDSTVTNTREKKYSKKEERKVYGDIEFGISREQYNSLIKQQSSKIGIYSYEFIPKFNYKNQLYALIIKGEDKTIDQFKKEKNEYLTNQESSKVQLVKLIEERYGNASEVHNVNDDLYTYIFGIGLPKDEYNSREYNSFTWEINSKRIEVFLGYSGEKNYNPYFEGFNPFMPNLKKPFLLSFDDPSLRITPVMRIINIIMAKENIQKQREIDSIDNEIRESEFKKESNEF